MELTKVENGKQLTVSVEGKLDTTSSPDFIKEVNDQLEGVEELVLDFEKLKYVSSAGLRAILAAQKTMNKQGSMKVINVNEIIEEIFDMTGFLEILTIE